MVNARPTISAERARLYAAAVAYDREKLQIPRKQPEASTGDYQGHSKSAAGLPLTLLTVTDNEFDRPPAKLVSNSATLAAAHHTGQHFRGPWHPALPTSG